MKKSLLALSLLVALPLAALGGTPVLGFAVVLCGYGLYETVRQVRAARCSGARSRSVLITHAPASRERTASIVRSTSSSEWASDGKRHSNWDGGT